MLDGYEGDEPSSLVHYPDLQKKVRRVIMQGYIDPEDFNGVCTTRFAACAYTNLLLSGPGDEPTWEEGPSSDRCTEEKD